MDGMGFLGLVVGIVIGVSLSWFVFFSNAVFVKSGNGSMYVEYHDVIYALRKVEIGP